MAWADIFSKIAEKKPIIHCITNIVTVNDCANVLLAIGASPVMAHHEMEVKEITSGSDALVCNMGAVENFEAMLIAGKSEFAGTSRGDRPGGCCIFFLQTQPVPETYRRMSSHMYKGQCFGN